MPATDIEKAIEDLNNGDTNSFVSKVNNELMSRAHDAMKVRKVAMAQDLFGDEEEDEDVEIEMDDDYEDDEFERIHYLMRHKGLIYTRNL